MVRVLVAGHSGLDKQRWLARLVNYAKSKGINDIWARDFDSMLSMTMPYFLDSFLERQRNRWFEVAAKILSEIESSGAEHAIVSMHLTYFRHNNYWSLIDINTLREFKFDMVITLIDDAYSVWKRIIDRESRERHGVYVRLRDVFIWRTIELMMADTVASALGIRNYMVAVKHPIETFYNLIFTNKPKIYLSHPISNVRGDEKAVSEINNFIRLIKDVSTVFEPTTIDEAIIEAVCRGGQGCVIDRHHRWPLIDYDDSQEYPIKLNMDEVNEVIARNPITKRNLIQDQIMRRDFRYIEQSDMVVAYRPKYRGMLSSGVLSEVTIAVQLGKPVYVYWPEEDGNMAENPFEYVHEYFSNIDELLKVLGDLSGEVKLNNK